MSRASRAAAIASVLAAEVAPVAEPTSIVAPKSIRQLVMGEITKGTPSKEIAVLINTHFPNTAAAAKSVKHIAWYRSRMKKDAAIAASAKALLTEIDEAAAE